MSSASSPPEAEILIVGGGLAGLATAYFLARLGARGVLLVEGNRSLGLAASSQNAGILRTLLSEAPLRPLAQRSREFFLSPPQGFSNEPLVDLVGLVLTADQANAAADLELSVAAHDLPVERLTSARLKALAPHVRTPALCSFFAPQEGHVFPARVIAGLAAGARAGGVTLRTGTPIAGLLRSGSRVCGVRLVGGREISARRVVLAAGAWGARLAEPAGSPLKLTPRRRHVLVGPADERINPRWPVVWNGGDTFYSKPADGGLWLCACDQDPVDPGPDGSAAVPLAPEELARIRQRAARHLDPELLTEWWPGGRSRDQRAWAGLRTFGQEERFRIGPDPEVGDLFWVGALGGHGLVTAPAVGELAARALLGQASAAELEPYLPSGESQPTSAAACSR
jgi:D-arginine dehydrogenase